MPERWTHLARQNVASAAILGTVHKVVDVTMDDDGTEEEETKIGTPTPASAASTASSQVVTQAPISGSRPGSP